MDKFELVVPCHFGLEAVVKREIYDLGYEITRVEDGRVSFEGDAEAICRANIFLRGAERVLLQVGRFKATTFDELFENVKALPWENFIPKDGNFWVKKASSIKSKLFSPSDIQSIVKKAMVEKFGYKNDLTIPRLHKIVLNMGVGEASHNTKIGDVIQGQLTKIAGQKAVVTKAKKSIATFKLREGMPVGAMVTLRGERMYDFLQKLICVVLPRIRDFRGISAKSFDGRGNYTLGLKEQTLFPEISFEEVDLVKGMNVSVITTAKTDEEARELLKLLGMPFKGLK